MENKIKEIRWTERAVDSLSALYYFYAEKSEQAAYTIVNGIIEMAESIVFRDQYQMDDINTSYRRMIVRHYKILYRTENLVVFIMDIIDVRQSPEIYQGID